MSLRGTNTLCELEPVESRHLDVDDGEVEAVANFLRQQGEPEYDDRVVEDPVEDADVSSGGEIPTGNSLYEQAVQLVVRE